MTDTTGLDMSPPPMDASVLSGDGVPDENQSLTCFSCDTPMTDLYCGNCGQKNDDFRRPLWRLGVEAFAAFTAIENRIWRTWGNLLTRPGRVPREYADGRRFHWSSPVRVYIFMSILLFGFMEVTGTYFFALELDLETKEGVEATQELTPDDVSMEWSAHIFPTDAQVESWNADLDFRLLREKLLADDITADFGFPEDLDIENLGDVIEDFEDGSEDRTPEERRTAIAAMERVRDGLLSGAVGPAATGLETAAAEIDAAIALERTRLEAQLADADEGSESVGADEPTEESDSDPGITFDQDSGLVLNGSPVSQNARNQLLLDFIRNPAIGNNILNRWLPRIIFLMMPLTMLISAMFIRGRGKRYKRGPKAGQYKGHEALLYDHIVHAAYIHAVAYLLIFIGILASRIVPGTVVAQVIFLALLVYLPLSLRRMFRRGWFKTIWTAYGVAFLYFVIVLSFTIWAVAVGIQEEITVRESLL